ncbi:hypothetical protein NHP190003_14560 [Helicobacter sp. NHP19-003]|uniref:ATPase RavA-like AAA lid domain-containing protein n=1 Tax=Helicobacter gastrocanis TaxID=2849641 RepID=A0ABM7SCN9_9HELI|nr:ATPase [Helicobacter sp. NHP19-003]BCZ18174.1 hypothetical protein NHP190003_14560 [Helicobacter sp. NHP19-003]
MFKQGDKNIPVPLKGIVCASNEFPPANQGLEALYDRMLLRYFVEPLKSKENFLQLIASQEGASSNQHAFSLEALEAIHKEARQIPFSPEAIESLHAIKASLEQLKHNPALIAQFLGDNAPSKEGEENTEPDLHLIASPSDRRFKQCAQLLQVSALLSDQNQVTPPDLALLRHCLWDSLEQIPLVHAILTQVLKTSHAKAKDLEKAQESLKYLEWVRAHKSPEDFEKTYQHALQEMQAHTSTLEQDLQEMHQNANVFLSTQDQEIAFSGTQEVLQAFKVLPLQLEEIYKDPPTQQPPKSSKSTGTQDTSKLCESITDIIKAHGEITDVGVIDTQEFKNAVEDIERLLNTYCHASMSKEDLRGELEKKSYPCSRGRNSSRRSLFNPGKHNCVPHLLGLAVAIQRKHELNKK